MYKIIGADGKEYGPITAEQLRQWVAEGRANPQTKVLLEGTTEWKPLSEYPEFAAPMSSAPSSLGASPPMMAAVPSAAAMDVVKGPATGLIVVAILGFLAQVLSLIWQLGFSAFAATQMAQQPWGNMFSPALTTVSSIIGIAVSGLILFGGLKMRKLENYGLAMTASIVAMIPCISPCCLIGLPIGIWAVVVLSKPEVKGAFH
jgi:hypothetical protein